MSSSNAVLFKWCTKSPNFTSAFKRQKDVALWNVCGASEPLLTREFYRHQKSYAIRTKTMNSQSAIHRLRFYYRGNIILRSMADYSSRILTPCAWKQDRFPKSCVVLTSCVCLFMSLSWTTPCWTSFSPRMTMKGIPRCKTCAAQEHGRPRSITTQAAGVRK